MVVEVHLQHQLYLEEVETLLLLVHLKEIMEQLDKSLLVQTLQVVVEVVQVLLFLLLFLETVEQEQQLQ